MIPLRLAREFTYQLDKAGEHERLALVFSRTPVFLVLMENERFELLNRWHELENFGYAPKKYYRAEIISLRQQQSGMLADMLSNIILLSDARAEWEFGVEISHELISYCEATGNKRVQIGAQIHLGWLFEKQGNYIRSQQSLECAIAIARELNSAYSEARGVGHIGIIHMNQGRYAEALSCFEFWLESAQKHHDKRGIFLAKGNIGSLYHYQNRFEEAATWYEESLYLAKQLGDQHGVARYTGNIGSLNDALGRYDTAIEHYKRQAEISESIGDKNHFAAAIGNAGVTLYRMGRYAEARESFEHQLAICRKLGFKQMLTLASGNIGLADMEMGKYQSAFGYFTDALAMSGELGEFYMRIVWLEHIAILLLKKLESNNSELDEVSRAIVKILPGISGFSGSENERSDRHNSPAPRSEIANAARKYAEECLRICQKISESEFDYRILLARIDAAEGNYNLAREKLTALFAEETDEEQRADLRYFLWKIDKNKENKDEAITRYSMLLERIPKFEFRKRIAELRGERVPISADDVEEPEDMLTRF